MNTKEIKYVRSLIKKQFGGCPELNYNWLKTNERVFILNREIDQLDTRRMRINSQGLYFGRLTHGELKLSIEGSQLIGPVATKNVLDLSEEQFEHWLRGLDLELPGEEKKFVIIKHNDDYFGCGRQIQGKLLNLVPKQRRIRVLSPRH